LSPQATNSWDCNSGCSARAPALCCSPCGTFTTAAPPCSCGSSTRTSYKPRIWRAPCNPPCRDCGQKILIHTSGPPSCLSAKSLKYKLLVSFCPPIFFQREGSLIEWVWVGCIG